VFDNYRPPLYLITFCTMHRKKCLNNMHVHSAFMEYCQEAARKGKASVGRYVIMPEHIHLFIRLSAECKLGIWMRGLKRFISNRMKESNGEDIIWQPGFFDHLLRSSESYAEKSNYVLMNPVRAGIVGKAEEWQYQGEVTCLYMS
jgi:putative transposase